MSDPQSTNLDADIIIVGAGMVGLLAAALLQSRYRVMLISPTELPIAAKTNFHNPLCEQKTQRMSAINPESQRLIASVTNWQSLHNDEDFGAQVYTNMAVTDGPRMLQLGNSAALNIPLGWIAHNQQLSHQISATLNTCETILARFDTADNTAHDLRQGKVTVGGKDLHAKLIIAADGANSPIRQMLEIPFYQHGYGQHGVVATIRHTNPNQQTARQWFVGKDILALLPIDAHHCSIVWSTHAPEDLLAKSTEELCKWLTEYSAGAVGEVLETTEPQAFPLSYGRAKQMVAGKVALIGDAAHRVHPMAGLGVNLGFSDAGTLAQYLDKDCRSSALARFQRRQQLNNWPIQQGIDCLYRGFQQQNPTLKAARQLGMHSLNQLPWLKQKVIQAASG